MLPRTVHVPGDALPPAAPFTRAGRVVARTELGSGGAELTVADAFATRTVRAACAPTCAIGALVEIDVHAWDGTIAEGRARVIAEDRRGDPTVAGETTRLRGRGRAGNLRTRALALRAVRAFFDARGYLEVETPIAVPSPGLDVHLDAVALEHASGGERFLITSPEYQMKRLLVGGLPRIFQIVKCFRKGEIGARHNPEFTMLEWYRAWSTFDAMIAETEALVVDVARAVRGRAELVVAGRAIDLAPPFERLPLATAFARHARMTEDACLALALSGRAEDEERWFRVLVEEVEPALAAGPPVVLVDWPASQASLARKKPGDPRVAERFELMVGGVELCNGFGELVDPREQRARFEADQAERRARGLPVYPIDERFLAALEEGMPESAGNALGLDRLIALAAGATEIGDVMTFPEGWL